MSRRFKYVIFDRHFPRITGDYETHHNLTLGAPLGAPTSAGFGELHADDGILYVVCFGESTSLGLRADPERDGSVLLRLFQDPAEVAARAPLKS